MLYLFLAIPAAICLIIGMALMVETFIDGLLICPPCQKPPAELVKEFAGDRYLTKE